MKSLHWFKIEKDRYLLSFYCSENNYFDTSKMNFGFDIEVYNPECYWVHSEITFGKTTIWIVIGEIVDMENDHASD